MADAFVPLNPERLTAAVFQQLAEVPPEVDGSQSW